MSPVSDGCAVGIDPGERWVGVARAAHGSSLALPLGTLDRRAGDRGTVDALKAMLGEQIVSELIVGVPLRADGQEDHQATAFREFGEALAESLGAACVAQDERFSSVSPERDERWSKPRFGRKSRAQGRKSVQRQQRDRERSHAVAAARILQRWLDARDGQRARGIADSEV